MKKLSAGTLLLFATLTVGSFASGCSDQNSPFKTLGESILGSTGVVSGSQVGALFDAGDKITKAATPVSERQEYYLGRAVSAMILSEYHPLANGELNAYVNRVGATVVAFSTRPDIYGGYHFLVLDTPEINAVSAPGGFVFVSKGLLKTLHDEDELAGVLGHEVGHIALAHGVNAISQANLTDALTSIGKSAAESYGGYATQQLTTIFGDSVKDVADTLLKKGYSRSQEYDADMYSAALLKKAGYNPQGLTSALSGLEKIEKQSPSGGWFSTHPSPEDRIDHVKSTVGAPSGLAGQPIRTARFHAAMKPLS